MAEVRSWFAPGRVNLIGEHLDYNGGPVLPFAIDRGTTLKARMRDDDLVRVWTTLDGGAKAEFDRRSEPGDVTGWASYVAGVFWALQQAGHSIGGADLVLDGDLSDGAGLSSSASLECVVAMALGDLCGLSIEPIALASIARSAEADFVGVPCGLTDQLAVMAGQSGHATLLDTSQDPPTVTPVPAGWPEAGLSLVVIDTNASHTLSDGQYANRRDECERAAVELGLDRLAAAGPDAVLRLEDETLKARTRHVITETARVRGAIRALGKNDWSQLGGMLTASHASLRDDFQVSWTEADVAVGAALEAGALGARMTGGGFGGSIIALVDNDGRESLADAILKRFEFHQFAAPELFTVLPTQSAHEITA